MATSYMAAMLDELMGRNRNLDPKEGVKELSWDSDEVCKYLLCGFCPNELFTHTRADLGPCEKIHDENLIESYKKSSRFEAMGYEEDMCRYLQSLLTDVDRRIKRGHARLQLNNMPVVKEIRTAGNGETYRVFACEMADGRQESQMDPEKQEQVDMLTRRINDLVEEAEQLGCEGKVEEAQGIMKLCEQLKGERADLENSDKPRPPPVRGNYYEDDMSKRMEVCDVCGALLVAGDAQQRIDEHISGKQHKGYARIREYLEERRRKRMQPIEEREKELAAQREEREKQRESEREERRKKEEQREKEREERKKREEEEREKRKKEREEKEKEREKQREKEREERRKRSRSRDRKRSRSRDRKRRSRSKDRRRSRSRDRHSRKRSRSHDRSIKKSESRRTSKDRDRSSRDGEKRKDSKEKKIGEENNAEGTEDVIEVEGEGTGERKEEGEKSKDRKRSRSRSKDRRRSRSRDKRRRSRSRDRKKRSRSRDRKRSRSRDRKRDEDKEQKEGGPESENHVEPHSEETSDGAAPEGEDSNMAGDDMDLDGDDEGVLPADEGPSPEEEGPPAEQGPEQDEEMSGCEGGDPGHGETAEY